jgi:catechol 2,3-dioxygenase-like lactoylglutathione lyase family enzyme
MRLFRVMVPVGDIDAAAAFYGRVLGMAGERVSGGRHEFDCEGTILVCEDAGAAGEVAGIGAHRGTVSLATDDLLGTWRRLVADLGTRGVSPIEDQQRGERTVHASDPWGNRVCFVDRATVTGGRRSG